MLARLCKNIKLFLHYGINNLNKSETLKWFIRVICFQSSTKCVFKSRRPGWIRTSTDSTLEHLCSSSKGFKL